MYFVGAIGNTVGGMISDSLFHKGGNVRFARLSITFVGFGAWAGFEFSTAGGNAFGIELFGQGNPVSLIFSALILSGRTKMQR